MEILDKILDSANKAGALQASAIWALVAIGLYWKNYQADKHYERYNEEWAKIRTQEAIADSKAADALAELAKQVARLNDEVKCNRTLIDERIPKGGLNV